MSQKKKDSRNFNPTAPVGQAPNVTGENVTDKPLVTEADEALVKEGAADESSATAAASTDDAPVEGADTAANESADQADADETGESSEDLAGTTGDDAAVDETADDATAVVAGFTESVVETTAVADDAETALPSEFTKLIDDLKVSGTSTQKILITSIEKYIDTMTPGKPVKDDAGAKSQYDLWKIISYLAEQAPGDEFKKLWNILLAYFEEYKDGVFHDRYIYRFSEFWVWPEHELNGMHRILNLVKLTCNPADRGHGLKNVSLDRSLTEGFSEEARQRITTFYNG